MVAGWYQVGIALLLLFQEPIDRRKLALLIFKARLIKVFKEIIHMGIAKSRPEILRIQITKELSKTLF